MAVAVVARCRRRSRPHVAGFSLKAPAHLPKTGAVVIALTAREANVDAVHAAGATLGLTEQWTTLKGKIQSVVAAPVTTPAKAFADYSGLTSGIESLIASDGNNSNMILDPDNDAYYVMDATLNRLTLLIDTSGQSGDLQTVIAAGGAATLDERLSLEDLKSAILTTQSNSDPDYARTRATPRRGGC
jgi:hypothetical protein